MPAGFSRDRRPGTRPVRCALTVTEPCRDRPTGELTTADNRAARGGAESGGMDTKDRRRELRGAVNRADGPAVVGLARQWLPTDEAPDLAAECAGRLRQRGWDGDDELADQLDAACGMAPVPMLRPLPVDLEELAMLLEGDDFGGGGRIDRRTGEIWNEAAIEYAEEEGEELDLDDDDRWLWVHCEGSSDGYRDMQAFIATLSDPSQADRLEIAIQGKGAFRRFK